MARHYHPRKFFRNVPNKLLRRFFHQEGVLGELAWDDIGEAKVDPIYDAWLTLDQETRDRLERSFREIDGLADEVGVKAILDEADWHGEDLAETFANMKGHHERAFWTFLKRDQFWPGAVLFSHVDGISPSYWRRRKNLPEAQTTPAEDRHITALEAALSHFFHKREGRGQNCKVEPYRRGELDYYFAYPEDYAQSGIEWIRGEFKRLPHHPAFEVIFVHNAAERTLDIYLDGDRKIVPDLQVIFASAILEEQIDANPGKDERVYDLQSLLSRGFPFRFGPESGIRSVTVKRLRLKITGTNRKITLEDNPSHNPNAVHDLLADIGKAIPSHLFFVTQAGIRVVFHPEPGSKRTSTKTFNVGWPNSCSLRTDGRDGIIRKMLADSGIEPKALSNNDAG
ncbi:MAG: hypothetical protein HQL73_04155 [Magnetococcales bacterium]|nr:hypothetical protein [Magnetococcales bacterium]